MSEDVTDQDELRGFSVSAARAVALAEREARELGHDRTGTEHLLLGLLTNDSDTSTLLTEAGVTLAAARHKVSEAVRPSPTGVVAVTGPLPRTARAGRALGRAARFAHGERSEVITSDHVLWGVLDVEGTAGQVLRVLGVEVDSLLRAVSEPLETDRGTGASRVRVVGAQCPSCGVALEGGLACRVYGAEGEYGASHDAVVYSCRHCGRVLGVAPA
jgi:ATP-dependent Clp protease ATP-binding subunit ClpA